MSKISEITSHVDWAEYLIEHEIDTKDTAADSEVRICCPFCGDDRYRMYVNTEKGVVFCHNCQFGERQSIIDFMAGVEGKPVHVILDGLVISRRSSYSLDDLVLELITEDMEKIEKAPVAFGLPAGSQYISNENLTLFKKEISYLVGRGLSFSDILRYRIAGSVNPSYSGMAIIPVLVAGNVVHWVARDCTGRRYRKVDTPKGGSQASYLFNLDRCTDSGQVVVCEGIFDAIQVEKAGHQAVACFTNRISRRQAELLRSFDEVVVLFDRDTVVGGKTTAFKAARDLSNKSVRVGMVVSYKDPGEAPVSYVHSTIEDSSARDSDDLLAKWAILS